MQRAKQMLHILFGSPCLPPMNRRNFIKSALLLFLVRWGVIEILGTALVWLLKLDLATSGKIGWLEWGFWLALGMVFFIPYFRIIHWRLVYIGFPAPRLFNCLILFAYLFIFSFLPDSHNLTWDLIILAMFMAPYLALLPWAEKSGTS